MSSRVTITPDPFTLIDYDVAKISAIIEDAAALVGFPPGVEISLDVDEELFPPLTGHMADIVDGRAQQQKRSLCALSCFMQARAHGRMRSDRFFGCRNLCGPIRRRHHPK